MGNTTRIDDSQGGVTTSVYNAVNLLTERDFGGVGQLPLRLDLTYTVRNQVSQLDRHSDLAGTTKIGETDTTYDDAGRTTQITHKDGSGTTLIQTTYTYDLASRLETETIDGSTHTLTYDAVNQLTDDGSNSYSFDLAGNRTMSGYQTGAGNQLTNDGVYTYMYDAESNRVSRSKSASDETWTFGYSVANQMTWMEERATSGGTLLLRVEEKYDALGRRIEEARWTSATGTVTTRFAYQGDNVRADLDGTNALVMRYVRPDGVDALGARINAAGVASWYLTDRQGTVQGNTDASGALSNKNTYDGFGARTAQTNASASDRYLYTGRELQVDSALQYNRARWYDTRTGSWTTIDPKGFDAGDDNLYRYVMNGPTNAIDPTGTILVIANQRLATKLLAEWRQNSLLPSTIDLSQPVAISQSDQVILVSREATKHQQDYQLRSGFPPPGPPTRAGILAALADSSSVGRISEDAQGNIVMEFEFFASDKLMVTQIDSLYGKGTSQQLLAQFTAQQRTAEAARRAADLKEELDKEAKAFAEKNVWEFPRDSEESIKEQMRLAELETKRRMENGTWWITIFAEEFFKPGGGMEQLADVGFMAGQGLGRVPTSRSSLRQQRQVERYTAKQPQRALNATAEEPLGGRARGRSGPSTTDPLRAASPLSEVPRGPSKELSSVFRLLDQRSCFVAGTPLLTPEGATPIEGLRPGDWVLARSQDDPEGVVEPKRVLNIFVRVAPIRELHIGGQTIRTTAEHPFYVVGRGWVPAGFLVVGDRLCSHDGSTPQVDGIGETREVTTVYNVEVEDHHTYFVGDPETWGFSVWAHNADYAVLPHPTRTGEFVLAERRANGSFRYVLDAGGTHPNTPRSFASAADAEAALTSGGGTRFTGNVPATRIEPLPGQTGSWARGTYDSEAGSLMDHYLRHRQELGSTDVGHYLRQAEAFKQNLRGATTSPVPGGTPGVTRYKKAGKYIDLVDADKSIISFGKQ